MKKLTPEIKKKIWKVVGKALLLLLIMAIITIIGYLILRAIGFTTQADFERLRGDLGDSFVFWLVIGLLQVFQVLFIPISNQIITVPVALMFPVNEVWKVYLTSLISIWVSTLILYIIGRTAGQKIMKWMLRGEEENIEKYTTWLKKGWMFYPLGMLLPFPDDILTILAGTAKMNFWFIAISSFFTRGIDIAISVYGWGVLTKYWWGWIIMAILGILVVLLAVFLFKYQKKKEQKQ